jgi:phage terminase Nu1 subunit (DNA packaging protein)
MKKTDHTTAPDGVKRTKTAAATRPPKEPTATKARPKITDAQREARSANAAKATEGRKAAVAARRAAAAAAVTDAGIPPLVMSEARLMAAKAEIAELDAAQRRGELIAVDKARADVDDLISTARTKILGVPSRLAQRDRTVTKKQIDLVEELLREALTELADDDG